jgi:hypothetical protein
MKILRNWFVLQQAAIALVSLTAAGISHAAPPKPGSEAAKIEAQADAAANVGHLSEAVAGWRKLWELKPNDPSVACNIGKGELRRGVLREAATWLKRCENLSPKATTPATIAFNKQVALELLTAQQKLSALVIDIDEPDTRVVIDDADIHITPLREDVFVEPGEHRIHAYNGLRTASMAISTVAGKEYRVALALALPPLVPLFIPILPPPVSPSVLPPSAGSTWWVRASPETFQWWPVAIGGILVTGGLAVGTGLFVAGNGADTNAALTFATIQGEGKTCSKSPAENDPRCAVLDQFKSQSSTYSTAAIASFIAVGVVTGGIIGYSIYENRRVRIATTVSGVTGRYQW